MKKSPAQILDSKEIYNGRLVKLRLDDVIEPGGVEATREIIVHPGSVVVLPLLPENRVVLVRQFRYATGQSLWELVAGGLEPRESPTKAARRELAEETGYRARRFRRLMRFFPTPGFVAEEMHLVLATGLTPGQARPESDERIEVRIFSIREVTRMLRAGKIRDGKTLVGLQWLLLFGCRGRRP